MQRHAPVIGGPRAPLVKYELDGWVGVDNQRADGGIVIDGSLRWNEPVQGGRLPWIEMRASSDPRGGHPHRDVEPGESGQDVPGAVPAGRHATHHPGASVTCVADDGVVPGTALSLRASPLKCIGVVAKVLDLHAALGERQRRPGSEGDLKARSPQVVEDTEAHCEESHDGEEESDAPHAFSDALGRLPVPCGLQCSKPGRHVAPRPHKEQADAEIIPQQALTCRRSWFDRRAVAWVGDRLGEAVDFGGYNRPSWQSGQGQDGFYGTITADSSPRLRESRRLCGLQWITMSYSTTCAR
jgi:hypothetical protein